MKTNEVWLIYAVFLSPALYAESKLAHLVLTLVLLVVALVGEYRDYLLKKIEKGANNEQ